MEAQVYLNSSKIMARFVLDSKLKNKEKLIINQVLLCM